MMLLLVSRLWYIYEPVSLHGFCRETAVALLKYYNKDRLRHEVKREDETIITPLTMLIEEMPGIPIPVPTTDTVPSKISYTLIKCSFVHL